MLPSDFEIAWLPRAVLHSVLWRVCVASTRSSVAARFLRKAADSEVLDVSEG